MSAAVVLSGGGVKSAVAAALTAREHEAILVHMNYGQPSANREAAALDSLAGALASARVVRIALPYLSQLRTAAADASAPAASRENRGIVGTSIPTSSIPPAVMRGLMPVFLSVGVQSALRFGAGKVVVGFTGLDDALHLGLPGAESGPDARREFLHAFNIMTEVLLRPKFAVEVEAPLIDLRYAEVIKLALRLRAPLDKTWTCQRFGTDPCGQCESCTARSRAFVEAELTDPGVSAPVPAGAH